MRNYSAIVTNVYTTYNVNCSEYVSNVSKVEHSAACALARALTISIHQLQKIREDFLQSGADASTCLDGEYNISPSELSVVLEFLTFAFSVHRCIDRGLLDGERNRAFVYHNLNTGASVLWTHVVV